MEERELGVERPLRGSCWVAKRERERVGELGGGGVRNEKEMKKESHSSGGE